MRNTNIRLATSAMSANSLKRILYKIADLHHFSLKHTRILAGGDINWVYLLETGTEKLVIKLNKANKLPNLFVAEKMGLDSLLNKSDFDIPKPLFLGELDNWSYLIMEYRPEGTKASNFWEDFGAKLAGMHQQTNKNFGYKINNYIGSLPQYNSQKTTAAEFYMVMRLEPQLKIAKEKGYDFGLSKKFVSNCESIIPQEPSSLIHGDLWNGNFLINTDGTVCLIDPAVAYAPREMDLAMMHLFGGFHKDLFTTYREVFPLEPGFNDRIRLWQLYYLLVHLNIFGSSYKPQVTSIIRLFS